MSSVWVVTSGEYSYFGIKQIFSNKEEAEKFVKIKNQERNYSYCHDPYEYKVIDKVEDIIDITKLKT